MSPVIRNPLLAVLVLFVSLCSGCAFSDDNHEDHWRRLHVLEVMRRANLPLDVDNSCLERGPAQEVDLIAVVKYRVGRALHRHAFVLPVDSRTAVGDTIEVNPRLCSIRLTSQPGQ